MTKARNPQLDILATGVNCPRCHVTTDEACVAPSGRPTHPHMPRIDRAIRLRESAQRAEAAAAAVPAAEAHTVPAGFVRLNIDAAQLRPGDVVVEPDGTRDLAAFDVDTDDRSVGFPTVKVWTAQADQANGRPESLHYATNAPLTVHRRAAGPLVTRVEAGSVADADDAATLAEPAPAWFELRDVAAAMPGRWHVDRIGGNVYALLDYAGHTLTINGGQLAADPVEGGPADVEVCRDGASVLIGTAQHAAGAAALLLAATGAGTAGPPVPVCATCHRVVTATEWRTGAGAQLRHYVDAVTGNCRTGEWRPGAVPAGLAALRAAERAAALVLDDPEPAETYGTTGPHPPQVDRYSSLHDQAAAVARGDDPDADEWEAILPDVVPDFPGARAR